MKSTEKISLRFNENGTFRILMVSDIQETQNYDPRALAGLRAMIQAEKPDLVILGGDNCDGRKIKSKEDLQAYLDVFTAPMEESHTPWMHIYGNHDYEPRCIIGPILQKAGIKILADNGIKISKNNASFTLFGIPDMYESYPHCISGHSPEGVPGVSNYMVPILSHDSETIAYCIYAFDTHHKEPVFATGATVDTLMLPNRPPCFRKWDVIRFEQQLWYWNLSKELEAKEGHKVPAMAVMHVAPQEVNMIVDNPEETGLTGEHDELMQCGVVNSGVFSTMLERGDVKIIAAGHSHEVTLDGVYGGIRFCLDGCAGFTPYGLDDHRGGRIFELNEDGSCNTYMVAIKDLMEI